MDLCIMHTLQRIALHIMSCVLKIISFFDTYAVCRNIYYLSVVINVTKKLGKLLYYINGGTGSHTHSWA